MKRPSFFLVGAAKCGTTALYEGLRKHPEIFMPHSEDPQRFWLHKEPFHFCGDLGIADWLRVAERDDFLNLFKEASEQAICGTASAWEAFSQEAPERIKEFEPEAKIIIMLRPPVTWMRSWHHDLLRYGYEDQVDFGQALAMAEERVAGRKMPSRAAFAGCLQYRKAARFSEQVTRYYDVFGRENVFVGLHEDLEKNQTEFTRNLLQFLGVDSSIPLVVERTNDSSVLKGTHHFDLAVERVVDRLPGGEGLKSWFGRSLKRRYRHLADKIFAPMSNKSISSVLEEELLEEFEPEVAQLGELIGRDLSHWNEPRFPRNAHEHDSHHH